MRGKCAIFLRCQGTNTIFCLLKQHIISLEAKKDKYFTFQLLYTASNITDIGSSVRTVLINLLIYFPLSIT